jgi:two-component system, chemotaxis family, CheB/CheR fusion protein
MARKVITGKQKTLRPFPIVAIGASAGGVEAISELVKNLPSDTGMAFVYIQHLDPTHKSMLPEILGRLTKMKVQDAKQRMRVEPNNIYVIPHDKNLFLLDGVLTLDKRQAKPAINLPVDKFFKSLAEVHKVGAIGVILSGNASDGTAGLKEIKNAGGLTFAQDGSAKFESMPKSAIAEGCVDKVLSPKDIALELGRISRNTNVLDQALTIEKDDATDQVPDENIGSIIALLRKSVGVDFQHYKSNTIKRRIIRRMLLYKLETFNEYLDYLKSNTPEINGLFHDLLINVTAFFRDPDTLEYLKKTALPKLISNKTPQDTIRVWVPACSTGEEAYSLAIIFKEILADLRVTIPVQIFASDLSENAIAKARIGLYSKADVSEVSPKILQRFFTKIDGSFRINKNIRDMCVFAPHNIFSDPPFSRLDLVSCCNLLIYLEPPLQKRMLSTFHYSLRSDGILILGKSETLGMSAHLFSQVEKKFKVFAKKNEASNKIKFDMTYRLSEMDRKLPARPLTKAPRSTEPVDGLEKTVEGILLSKYVSASVVVTKELDIVQFHGPVSTFIEISPGKATLNLLKMVRPELVFDLKSIIHKAIRSRRTETKSAIEMKVKGGTLPVSIEVVPIGEANENQNFLIVFEKLPSETHEELRKSSFTKDQVVKKLRQELENNKEDMRSILEEQEAANEELQSANEEIVSSNEELQSINEELETSKEEVESSNEELMTINKELQVRNEQLAEAYEYSEAVSGIIREAVLILDKDVRVRSANKAFYRIFKTKEEETEGMLLYELGNRQWDILELRHVLEEINTKRTAVGGFEVSHDFPTIGRKTMLLHAKSLIQKVHQKEIIILAIEDITEHRRAQKIAEEKELWFRNMANNAPCIIWMGGLDQRRSFFNKTWFEFTGIRESDGHDSWAETIHPDDVETYKDHYVKGHATGKPVMIEYRMKRSDGEYRWMMDIAKPYYDENKLLGYIGTSTEMHDKKLMLEELDRQVKVQTSALKSANDELIRSNSELEQFAHVASHDLQEPLRKILTYIDRIEHNKEHLSTPSAAHFKKITESATRMTKLIDDLLEFSRISLKEYRFETVDLGSVIEDVATDFDVVLAEKGAKLIYDKTFPIIDAHELQMTQLFHNLIGNAIKFSKNDASPQIAISHRHLAKKELQSLNVSDREGSYIEISVSDNGIGFDPEFAERIFEIFQRLNEEKKYPGTGIGLALCKRIVANHKGVITAHSSKDGATFKIVIPVRQE